MGQIVQVLGSLLILVAFAAAQRGRLQPKSRTYLLLNIVGSTALAVDAALGQQWGFLMLEGVWSLVSAVSLVSVLWQTNACRSCGMASKAEPTTRTRNA